MKVVDEPCSSGDGSVRAKPKFGVEGEASITRGEIFVEGPIRVIIQRVSLCDDPVTLEELISFVARQHGRESCR
jgi:hypothetical protein